MGKRLRQATPKEAVKAMAVRLPHDLRQRLKVHAASTDTRIQAILAAAIDEFLKKRGA